MGQKIRQDMSIGGNIQKLRLRCGFTQEQVVAKLQVLGCNISRSAYSQIELGTYNVRVSELVAMSAIFKADYADFFKGLSL